MLDAAAILAEMDVIRMAAARCRPRWLDLDDAIQEAFMECWLRRDTFDSGRGPLRAWLFAKSAARMRDLDRAHRATKRYAITLSLDEPLPDTGGLTHADVLAAPEQDVDGLLDLRSAMSRVTPPERRVLHLRYWQDQGYREIAGATGISKSMACHIDQTARRSLALMLAV